MRGSDGIGNIDNIMDTVHHLQTLANTAMMEKGFITVMAGKSTEVQQDIPAAFESYGLLSHFLHHLPVRHTALSDKDPPVELAAAIHFDADNGRLLALVPIGIGELDAVAHWYTASIMSTAVKQMQGLLALPFSLETHAETEVLIPDWCAAFFANGKSFHCIPILTLRSILSKEAVGQDWVNAALARLRTYALPVSAAMQSIFVQQTGSGAFTA